MVPCINNAASDMFSLRRSLVGIRGLLNVDRQLLVGPEEVSVHRHREIKPGIELMMEENDGLGMSGIRHGSHLVGFVRARGRNS